MAEKRLHEDVPDEGRRLLSEPDEFVQNLSSQIQLLGCLKWLCEFQVPALIPLHGSIRAKEVADLAGVPKEDLCRIIRMSATAGFLCEPQYGHIAHTPLSAAFVAKFSLLDAAMFLAECVAPVALQMTATRRDEHPTARGNSSAYSAALGTADSFEMACEKQERLRRQWAAYRGHAGSREETFIQLMGRQDWSSLGRACVVDVCAQSVDDAAYLASMHPSLHLVVQMVDSDDNSARDCSDAGQVTIQKKTLDGSQPVTDASVYMLRMAARRPLLDEQILAELYAHLGILQANTNATLLLAPPLLPEPGSVDSKVEATARLRDLCQMQFNNQCEIELNEVVELVGSVCDGKGHLVVAGKLFFDDGTPAAVSVKYRLRETSSSL